MHKRLSCALVLSALFAGGLAGGEGVKSGPPPGKPLPGPFHPFNLNGEKGKGKYHCLVCEYGLDPVVVVFTRTDSKDPQVLSLLKRLDELVKKEQKNSYLHGFAVFLSKDASDQGPLPDAAGLTDEQKKKLVEKLIDEEANHDKLAKSLTKVA